MELVAYYRTQSGSTVRVSGPEHVCDIDFHWLEESACVGAKAGVEADLRNPENPKLTWRCGCCTPGSARLSLLSEQQLAEMDRKPGEANPGQESFGFFT